MNIDVNEPNKWQDILDKRAETIKYLEQWFKRIFTDDWYIDIFDKIDSIQIIISKNGIKKYEDIFQIEKLEDKDFIRLYMLKSVDTIKKDLIVDNINIYEFERFLRSEK